MAVSKESGRLDPLFPLWAVPEFAKNGAADENTLCPVVSGIHAPAAYGRGCGTYGGVEVTILPLIRRFLNLSACTTDGMRRFWIRVILTTKPT